MRLAWLALVLGVLATACAPAPAAGGPPAAQKNVIKLRVGVATSPAPALPESTLWLAQDLGFYQKEGLDVDITEVNASPLLITALRAGEIDIGDINSEDVIRLTASKDLEMRTINSASGRNFFMIVGKDSIGSILELQGKSFAIARVGSQDHALSSKVMTVKGLQPDTVNYVAVGAPNLRAQALVAGQIDATTVSLGTWVTVQNQKNIKVLVNVDDYFNALPLVNKGNAVTTRVLAEKPEALRRFTAAIVKASRYFAQNRSAWVEAIAKRRPDIGRADLEYLWDQFGSSWAVNGQMNLSAYQASTDFLYESGTFNDAPRIDAKDWADAQFVDSVLTEVGVIPNIDDPGRAIK
jgi:NitT/TauT family transport system substrate-binding protein